VLGPDHPHIAKADESPATQAAREILDHRGNSPRQYRNMVVFAAADQRSLEGLEQATAEYLAWLSICDRVAELNLDAHQTTQARTRRDQSNDAVGLRLVEAYKYVIIPRQDDPIGKVTFDVAPLDQQGTVAQRASRRMVSDGTLATRFPPVMLRLKLDNELARRWADGHVAASTLWDDFAKYVYLPRLRDQEVLVATIEAGPASVTWQTDGYAVAVGIDEATGRYLSLATGSHPGAIAPTALVVRPEFAIGQQETDPDDVQAPGKGPRPAGGREPGTDQTPEPSLQPVAQFRGSVVLDVNRPIKHFGDISKEVLDHLAAQVGVELDVRVEITARKPDGFSDGVIRTVSENARTLKFDGDTGFTED
jgi:hypothetical protein